MMSAPEITLGDAGFDVADLDLDLVDLELLDDIDLDDLDVVEVWYSLHPSDRFIFADRVYTYGTREQSAAITALTHHDHEWDTDDAAMLFELDGGAA